MRPGQIDDVIAGGYCIGCGSCAAAAPDEVRVELSQHGTFRASIDKAVKPDRMAELSRQCPFADAAANEDTLGRSLFGAAAFEHRQIGWFRSAWAARVNGHDLFTRATSGGIIRWLCQRLVQDGHADGAIMVTETPRMPGGPALFGYAICRTPDEIAAASRSAYYPVTANAVFAEMRKSGGRYVFVGTPCFVKAARLMADADPQFARTLVCSIALFCGHLKSSFFAELISRQLDVDLDDATAFDFRHRAIGAAASDVAVKITAQRPVTAYYRDLFGTDYGHGFFKYKACDYCDDIVGELGDVSVGDAWLPQYLHQGTSAVVIRTPFLDELFRTAMASGELWAESLTPAQVVQSQESNFRHRRDGLRYRLWKMLRCGQWAPRKRVAPSRSHLTRCERLIFDLREKLRDLSFSEWLRCRTRKDRLRTFITRLRPLTLHLDYLNSKTKRQRFTRLGFRVLNRLALFGVAKACLALRRTRKVKPMGGVR